MTTSPFRVFGALEDFSRGSEDASKRHQRELEERVAEALEQGYQRGLEAVRKEVQVTADQRFAEMTRTFSDEKSAAEKAWQEDTGKRCADAFNAGIEDIGRTLGAHVANLLKPLLRDALYRGALDEFHQILDRAISDGVSVEVRGSQPLVQAIEQRIGQRARIVSTITDAPAAVELKIQKTTISADFAAWRSKLEEHLA